MLSRNVQIRRFTISGHSVGSNRPQLFKTCVTNWAYWRYQVSDSFHDDMVDKSLDYVVRVVHLLNVCENRCRLTADAVIPRCTWILSRLPVVSNIRIVRQQLVRIKCCRSTAHAATVRIRNWRTIKPRSRSICCQYSIIVPRLFVELCTTSTWRSPFALKFAWTRHPEWVSVIVMDTTHDKQSNILHFRHGG